MYGKENTPKWNVLYEVRSRRFELRALDWEQEGRAAGVMYVDCGRLYSLLSSHTYIVLCLYEALAICCVEPLCRFFTPTRWQRKFWMMPVDWGRDQHTACYRAARLVHCHPGSNKRR